MLLFVIFDYMFSAPNNGEYYEADDDEDDHGVSDEDVVEASNNEQEGDEYFDDNEEFADDGQNSLSSSSSSQSSISSVSIEDNKVNPRQNNQGSKQPLRLQPPAGDEQHQQQLKRTVTASTSNIMKSSEKIHGFALDEQKRMFDSLEYISQESIAKAILRPCCVHECLRKKLNSSAGYSCLNFESVYSKVLAARKQLVGNDFKDKVLILKTIIQGT